MHNVLKHCTLCSVSSFVNLAVNLIIHSMCALVPLSDRISKSSILVVLQLRKVRPSCWLKKGKKPVVH
jgi:hypothetical protein